MTHGGNGARGQTPVLSVTKGEILISQSVQLLLASRGLRKAAIASLLCTKLGASELTACKSYLPRAQ